MGGGARARASKSRGGRDRERADGAGSWDPKMRVLDRLLIRGEDNEIELSRTMVWGPTLR